MPRRIVESLQQPTPLIRRDQPVSDAVTLLLDQSLAALPVVDDQERFVGIFGEREFIAALFPGYVATLKHAAFVPSSIDSAIEKRQGCRLELVGRHMTTDHVDVGTDVSDVQLAEVFLHHRVLIVPVTDERGRVTGIIGRDDFFAALARRFLEQQAT